MRLWARLPLSLLSFPRCYIGTLAICPIAVLRLRFAILQDPKKLVRVWQKNVRQRVMAHFVLAKVLNKLK